MSYLPSAEKLAGLGFSRSPKSTKRVTYTSKQPYGHGLFIRRSIHQHPVQGRLRLLDCSRGAATVFAGCYPNEDFFDALWQAVGWQPAG